MRGRLLRSHIMLDAPVSYGIIVCAGRVSSARHGGAALLLRCAASELESWRCACALAPCGAVESELLESK